MSNIDYSIRDALPSDVPEIARIWLEGARNSLGGDPEVGDLESFFRERVEMQDETFKFWVAVDGLGRLIGWQSLMPTNNNPALRPLTAMSSTYIDGACRAKGLGTELLGLATRHADTSRLHFVVGDVASANTAVRHIIRKLGWLEVGVIPASEKSPKYGEKIFVVYVARELAATTPLQTAVLVGA